MSTISTNSHRSSPHSKTWPHHSTHLEDHFSSLETVLVRLRTLQEVDLELVQLENKERLDPDLKARKQQMDALKATEQNLLKLRDSIRVERNQTQGALELCRDRMMKADLTAKTTKDQTRGQAILREIDKLKVLEQDLESKAAELEKNFHSVLIRVSENQKAQKVLLESPTSSGRSQPELDRESKERITELLQKRDRIASGMPPAHRAIYERLLPTRGGIAVVGIRGHSCMGCNMMLPLQFVNQVRRRNSIENCPNCKRILTTHD